jgi:putative acyl-CoA dehydrogenase
LVDFYQSPPVLRNQFEDDRVLREYAHVFFERRRDIKKKSQWESDYRRLGELAAGEWSRLADQAESEPPRHIPFDPWGNRIDEIRVSEAWKEFGRISAREGFVASGYEKDDGEFARTNQFIRLFLFAPSSAIYTCPLAMTDGAARAIELYGSPELKKRALGHLLSRDPASFWTSGQWMTERTGGSDVSGTSTVAKLENGRYRLYGTKWFTSATTSQTAMTLARTEGAEAGSRGLSLFYLELRDEYQKLRNITVHRLKEKLGTHALPTAELTLDGTPAELVGDPGNGVKKISSLFNVTRIYNACCAVAGMRRGLALACDFARKRRAFGKPLSEHPLHVQTLAELQVDYEACFHLVFKTVELLGKDESGKASQDESKLLRLLTPIIKLYTARKGVALASEVLESFGGAGYVEDTGLPRLLRDAQVLAIWEGTTNVLSLDVLRAIEKEGVFEPFVQDVSARLSRAVACDSQSELKISIEKTTQALSDIQSAFSRLSNFGATAGAKENAEAGARAFAFRLAEVYAASLAIEHAASCQALWKSIGKSLTIEVSSRLSSRFAKPPVDILDQEYRQNSAHLLGF